jgi:DMSO/TMAO reductase YedYZ molybdopterin-dependent catalytic subunit
VNTVRAAAFLQIITAFSAAWTLLLVVPILYWQVTSWIRNGEWSPFPISKVLALAGFDQPATYITASIPDSSDASLPNGQGIFVRLLDFPTTGLLLAVAAILLTFSISAASIQKQFAAIEK